MTLEENLLHSDSVEKNLLGSITVDNSIMADVLNFVRPEMFTVRENRVVFDSMVSLYDKSVDIDSTSIFSDIVSRGLSDQVSAYDVTTCTPYAPTNQAVYNSKLIAESYIKRQLSAKMKELSQRAENPSQDAFELIENGLKSIEAISDVTNSASKEASTESFADIVYDIGEMLDKQREDTLSGVPSGLTLLDNITNGFQKGELIILAARPAMGKSALATTIMANAAMQGFPCAMFSLEMKKSQVVGRISGAFTGLNVSDINKRRLFSDQKNHWKNTMQSFKDLPIFVNDSSSITLTKLKSEARKLKRKNDIQLIVVDYLQLMSGENATRSREQEVSEISRGLKALASELDLCIVALSQLSRAVENRDIPRPILSDLRESGSIEQDANIVMFLFRAEYYREQKGEDIHPEEKGMAQLLIAKNRDGELGNIDLNFIAENSLFKDREIKL